MITVEDLRAAPTDADLHRRYALQCLDGGQLALGYAELRTAMALGAEPGEEKVVEALRKRLPDLEAMPHNSYFRFHVLRTKLRELSRGEPCRVLDVGGGHGELAQFLPEAVYCLAEPDVNGISGLDLPFEDRSFDWVVACHVLEHVPLADRDLFLDQLWSKSRRGIVLLNPFEVEGTHVEDRLRLSIAITDSRHSKEHLACSLPRVEHVTRWAASRGLSCAAEPKGTLTVAHAMLFMEFFGRNQGCHAELEQINRFYNTKYLELMDSPTWPGAYLVTFQPAPMSNETQHTVHERR